MGKKTREGKNRANNRANKKRKLGLKPKKNQNTIKDKDPILFSDNNAAAGSDDDEAARFPGQIQRLLEPYTKDQLTGFLLDAAADNTALLAQIRSVADGDVSHRKIFVHGLSWETTHESLLEAFQPYGEIEDCKLVVDKATGRAKGFGFVLFRTRAGADKALKQPQKTIKNRLTTSQLASVGPAPAVGEGPQPSAESRRVYVSNVHADAARDKLKAFFAEFGEIKAGPFGFDMNTGKSRGFALFVYNTQEGASRALEEPYKMFEGHKLHCHKATKARKPYKMSNAAATMVAAQQPALAAMVASQNLALYSQNPANAAFLGQNPLLAAPAMNPWAAAALNPAAAAALNPSRGPGISGGASSVLGSYGSQGLAGLHGLQPYHASQLGQSSSSRLGSSLGGFASYM